MENSRSPLKMFDCHSHSHFSPDSNMDISEAVSRGRRLGLSGIAITDHFDFDAPVGIMCFTFDPAEQQREIERIRMEIGSDFKILKGIELGLQPHCMEEIKEIATSYSFDTVIASVHFIEGKDPYHGEYYIPYKYKRAYGHYLETIYDCMELFDDYDILGHFDYIARYSPYPESVTYSDFKDVFDAILTKLVKGGKSFEINTKTYHFYRGKETLLDVNILRRFKELGGEAISFGSDAHGVERLGENFERFIPIVKSTGIKYSVYYEKREPHFLPL